MCKKNWWIHRRLPSPDMSDIDYLQVGWSENLTFFFSRDEKIHSGLGFSCEYVERHKKDRGDPTSHSIMFLLARGFFYATQHFEQKRNKVLHINTHMSIKSLHPPWHVSKTIFTLRCTLGPMHRMCPCHLMWSHSALWFLHVKRPSNGNKLVCFSTWPGEACRFWPLWMMWWISVCLVGVVFCLIHIGKVVHPQRVCLQQKTMCPTMR